MFDLSRPDEEVLDKREEAFSSICHRLLSRIQQQKPIQERELFDFSRITIWNIRVNATFLLETLDELSRRISDYWHFEVNNDTNLNRKHSYIRLYQVVSLFQIFCQEQEREKKACIALRENGQNMGPIISVQRFPGITHRKLRELLQLSTEELQTQLEPLKKEGFLIGHRSGEDQFYMLTNDGEALYNQLCIQQRQGRFSKQRMMLRNFILQILLPNDASSIQILTALELIQELSDEKLKEIIMQLFIQYQSEVQRENTIESQSDKSVAYPIASIYTKYIKQLQQKTQFSAKLAFGGLKSESIGRYTLYQPIQIIKEREIIHVEGGKS